jgi:hypothetical protein
MPKNQREFIPSGLNSFAVYQKEEGPRERNRDIGLCPVQAEKLYHYQEQAFYP